MAFSAQLTKQPPKIIVSPTVVASFLLLVVVIWALLGLDAVSSGSSIGQSIKSKIKHDSFGVFATGGSQLIQICIIRNPGKLKSYEN